MCIAIAKVSRLFLIILLLLNNSLSPVQAGHSLTKAPDKPANLPVPKNIPDMKFYLQRDPNTNTVVYALNRTPQGTLNEEEPIQGYWIRYAEQGQKQELSYIQRKFAYGLKTKKLGKDNYEVRFVSYAKKLLYLRKTPQDNQYRVYTTINQKECILDRIFVRIEGGTFWVPNVLYVELIGRDTATGKEITSRINP